jgi:serine/threonine-protein kinase
MQGRAPWLAANRYEVGEVVGRGGYGMVCRGVDRKTGRSVALKMLSPEAGKDPDVVERMLREQQALVALSGTCAVTAIDLCRLESGAPCLVMEWLDGRDLEQQLSEWEARGYLGSTSDLLALLKPLCETLTRAHEIGIVHRDIKPANIFVTEGAPGGVRLLDFGLSRMKSAAPLTAVGMVMGSPSYIAPETWRGNSQALDGRADLFALGVLAFRWLTGVLPFDAPDLIGKMTAVTSGPRPSAVALRPELPATVDAWFKRALAVEPADRFQTGGDLYAAFEAALRGLPWQSSADVSGMRRKAEAAPVSTAEKKNALAAAWSAAAS